jgi:hypothetical protein
MSIDVNAMSVRDSLDLQVYGDAVHIVHFLVAIDDVALTPGHRRRTYELQIFRDLQSNFHECLCNTYLRDEFVDLSFLCSLDHDFDFTWPTIDSFPISDPHLIV